MTETQARPEDVDDDRLPASVSRALVPCDVPLDLGEQIKYADAVSRAGILPDHLRGKPGNVLAIMAAARALNIPLWPAMSEMVPINGKIGMSAQLMRGLWYRAGHSLRYTVRTAQQCTVVVRRADEDEDYELTFTIEDAIQAGLVQIVEGKLFARSKSGEPLPWQQYTKSMLVARATAAVLREKGSDVLLGFHYTPEELGATQMGVDGVVYTVTAVEETPAEKTAREAEARARWDAAVTAIEAAGNEKALRELWMRFREEGIVRLPFEDQGTLDERIIARREQLEHEAAAREAAETAEASQEPLEGEVL